MNKQRERATVEAFLISRGFPTSRLIDCNRERPDALIDTDGGIVGVEVTTVVEASPRYSIPPQKWTAEAVRIVRKTQAAFERNYHRPLIVRLELRPDWDPGTVEASVLATELANCVAQALAVPQFFARPEDPITRRDPHPALSWLYAAPVQYGPDGHWAPAFASHAFRASADDIRATVRKKEVELDAYHLAAPRVWLLVDCNLSGQGFALDVPESFDIATGFDRVFCCGFGMWQWVEIRANREAELPGAAVQR